MKPQQHTEHLQTERVPVFIADPELLLAYDFVKLLAQDFLPIVLTKRSLPAEHKIKAIIVAYRTRIPKIPDNAFVGIYFVQGESQLHDDLFRSVLNEAKRKEIPFYLVASRRNFVKKVAEQVLLYEKGKVFLYGDIFDDSQFINPVASIVHHAREKHKATIADQGLQPIFPVSKKFVSTSIIRYSIVEKTEYACLVLTPRGEMYEISLARMLQQMQPDIQLSYSNDKKKRQAIRDLPSGAAFVSEPDDSLKASLRKELEARKNETITSGAKRGNLPNSSFRFIYVGILSVVFFLALVLFLIVGIAFFGERLLVRSLGFMNQMQFSKAKEQALFAKSSFLISDSTLQIAQPLAGRGFLKKPLLRLQKKLKTGEKVSFFLGEVADGALVYQKLFFSNSTVKRGDLALATEKIKNSIVSVSEIAVENGLPGEYAKKLSDNQKSIDFFIASSDILPDLLGFGGEKQYLILFQNNNELRPGGGFIGSFAIVKVKNGKIGEVIVQDVYDADGQLKGHVEPPSALKKYLGISHWYLRDSNFSPDFPEDGANAAFFLNLETGKKVDGVVAIDSSVIERLLTLIGPLELPNAQKEVGADNVIELTQAGAESNFFPGSTQKKDFLNELYGAIVMKLGQNNGRQIATLIRETSEAIAQKHILLSFSDAKLSFPFLLQGASSTLETNSLSEKTVNDFIGVNEANVGTNKVNKYIARSFFYNIAVSDDNTIATQITETLENKSQKKSSYGGEYKVYVRFILPENVSPEQIEIDGIKQVALAPLEDENSRVSRGAVAANTLEVERIDIKGKSTYGFFLSVPPMTKKTVMVKYSQHTASGEAVGKYSLTLFKQPGTGPDPYLFTLTLPASYSLLSSSRSLKNEGGRYSMLSQLSTDQKIMISYGKK